MKVACIVHGKKKPVSLLASLYDDPLFKAEMFSTKESGHAIALAKQAIEAGFERLIAVGGDGTLNEVVNGILHSSRPDVPLLFYPWGTGNDWGRTFSPPSGIEELKQRLVNSNGTTTDVGEVSFRNANGDEERRFFINIADAGMGANVVRKVNNRSKWLGPRLTFFKAIIETFFSFSNKSVKCFFDEDTFQGMIRSVVIANGKYFGGGLCIAPEANPTDGKFSIVIIGDVSIMEYLKYLPAIRRGEIIHHPKIKYLESKSIKITSPQLLELEADGEYLGFVPCQCRIVPGAISML